MKNHPSIALIGFGFLLAAAPAFSGQETEPTVLIEHACQVLMNPDVPRESTLKALTAILDAALLILPKADYTEEFGSRIGAVKKIYEEGAMFSEKARQYIGLAYRMVSGGATWRVPEELTSAYREKDVMGKARSVCRRLADSALAGIKAGRNEEAVRDLLSLVLLVITPIEA